MDRFTEYEKSFIKDNYEKMTAKEISDILGRTKRSIDAYIRRHDIKKPDSARGIWTDEQLQYLAENFGKESKEDISQKLNKTIKSIEVKASRLGLKEDGWYLYDESKFASIETEEDAYWLGFLYADGYVCITRNTYWFGCELQRSDEGHLKKLIDFMGSNRPITYFDKTNKSGIKSTDGLCGVTFHRKSYVRRLIELGCTQRKSLTIQMPFGKFDDSLMRHFIRGYFDGDGSLGDYRKYKYTNVSIECGSKMFLDQIAEYILATIGVKCYVHPDNTCWKLSVRKQEDAGKFLNYMYKDSHIYLERKYQKYLSSNCLGLQ